MESSVLKGALKAVPIPDVLTFLNYLKKTGTLTVESGGRTRKVYFHGGEMIFASSTEASETLGWFLVRRGKITHEQNQATVRQIGAGKRHGKILVAQGYLTPAELWKVVQSQVLEIIYALFPIKEGTFWFEETAEPHEEKITLTLPATNIILEGVRRMDEWPRIQQMVPDDLAIPQLEPVERRDPSVELMEDEMQVLGLVDGQRNVLQILREWHQEEFEGRRCLATLIMARYVYLPQSQSAGMTKEEEDTEAILSHIASFNDISALIVDHLRDRLPMDSLMELMQGVLESVRAPELQGAEFDEKGILDPRPILANVADLPAEMRRTAVGKALAGLMSSLFVASDFHLNPGEKRSVLLMAEKMAKRQKAE